MKTVVITGASAGIGAHCARLFAAKGHRIVLAARGLEALEQTAAELDTETLCVPTDVGDVDQCVALIDKTVEAFGGMDVLVNNAGLHHRGPFDRHDAHRFAAMVDVNLRGPIVLARAALPHLRESRGSIVNVASLAGFVPLPGAVVYSSTKFGLRAFSRALYEEERGVVAVSLVSPGPVSTEFIMGDVDKVDDIVFAQPMSTPEQIAQMVVDCAEDGRIERKRPSVSAAMATVAYLFPGLGRAVRPAMMRRGARVKESYRK